jgi:hypothetical protein
MIIRFIQSPTIRNKLNCDYEVIGKSGGRIPEYQGIGKTAMIFEPDTLIV